MIGHAVIIVLCINSFLFSLSFSRVVLAHFIFYCLKISSFSSVVHTVR